MGYPATYRVSWPIYVHIGEGMTDRSRFFADAGTPQVKRPILARGRLTAFVSARRKAVVQDQFINQDMTGRFG